MKYALRNLRRNKIRTFAIIISVSLVIFLYASTEVFVNKASEGMVKTYLSYVGGFDIFAYKVKPPSLYNITNVSTAIDDISGVSKSANRLIMDTMLYIGSLKTKSIIVGIKNDDRIGYLRVIKGKLDLSSNSCAMSLTLSSVLGIDVGDNITISALANRTFKISAIVEQDGFLPSDMKELIILNIEEFWDVLGVRDVANFLFIKVEECSEGIDDKISRILNVSQMIQKKLGFEFKVVPVSAYILDAVQNTAMLEKTVLQIASFISLIMVSLLLILVSTLNMEERIQEIGLLRAMGSGISHSMCVWVVEYVIEVLIGLSLGLAFTLLLSRFILNIQDFNDALVIILNSHSFWIVVLITIVSAILTSFIPVIKAHYEGINEILNPFARRVLNFEKLSKKLEIGRPIGPLLYTSLPIIVMFAIAFFMLSKLIEGSEINFLLSMFAGTIIILLLAMTGFFTAVIPPILRAMHNFFARINLASLSLAISLLLSRKRRMLIAFSMVTLALTSIYFIGSLIETQSENIKISIEMDMGAPVIVSPRENLYQNFSKELLNLSYINEVCPVVGEIYATAGDIIQWKTRGAWLYGISPLDYVRATYTKEYFPNAESMFKKLEENMTAIISTGLADALSIKEGEEIRIDFWSRTFKLKIVGIMDRLPGFRSTRFASRAYSTAILVSINTMKRLLGYEPQAVKFFVWSNEPEKATSEIISKLGNRYSIQVKNAEEELENVKRDMELLLSVLTLILNFSLGISVFGLVIYIVSSTRERVWELALLRSLGLSRGQTAMMLLAEHLLIPLLAFGFSIITALVTNIQINYLVSSISEVSSPVLIHTNIIMSAFVSVVIPSLVTSVLMIKPVTLESIAKVLRESAS